MHSSPISPRTLLVTLLAGGLGFAAGSWRDARLEKVAPVTANEPAPARPPESTPTPAHADAASATKPEATSLRERLKEVARARNPLAAAAEAQALISTLTAEDFRELAAQPKDFPFPNSSPGDGALYSRAYMDALVRRWLEVDPEGGAAAMRALDAALTYKREGNTSYTYAGRGLLPEALARFRPTSGADIAEAFASGARKWKDDPTAAREAFEQLARTDLARALALSDRITDKTERIMAQMAVQKGSIRETDPVEVARVGRSSDTVSKAYAAAAEQGPEKLRAAIEASIFKLIDTTALVAEGVIRDPDVAWDTIPGELAGKPESSMSASPKSTAQMLARQLSPEDRQRSLATADRLPKEWRTAALEPLVGAWALDEPQAAIEWVAQKSERSEAAFAAFGPWVVSEADAALAWVEKGAPPAVRQALAGQLARTFEAGEKARQSSGPMAMLNRAPADARATAAALLEHSPAAAARLVAELPTAEPAGTAFQPIFEKWLDRDAPAAAQWLEAQPASRRRDEAVASFAAAAATRDAEGAAQWVTTIADAALRQKAADSVFRAMELRDPAAARAWRDSLAPPP
jgi:hypothetical protein